MLRAWKEAGEEIKDTSGKCSIFRECIIQIWGSVYE